MPNTTTALTAAGETYFADLGRVRASGGATGERSSYGPLANLLNAVGATLAPNVFCVGELADQGAGHPDFGLYAAKQVQQGRPREAQVPERGVVEVKAAGDDAWLTAAGDQVSRYWGRYRLVLVTNTRDFVLVGEDAAGRPTKLETFRLAADADTFVRRLETPRAWANISPGRCRTVRRWPSQRTWRGCSRRMRVTGSRGSRRRASRPRLRRCARRWKTRSGSASRVSGGRGSFIRRWCKHCSMACSPWVLWSRADTASQDRPLFAGGYSPAQFDWRTAVWHLRAPVLRALFQQLSDPGRLQPLGLVEVLDWTAAALNRVDRAVFFARFTEGEAVPYFYEPFLEAFDPELRKELGVWYTPPEVVRYMVARVDRAVRDDLGIADGLAAENVYVLDPCCGTGAYLAEVLRRIAANLASRGLGALAGARVKQAAVGRVFGFEIMPAAFVVAHLQIGLTLQDLDAPLADDGTERAGVFLTNALTGWEPRTTKPLPFPELEEERDRADQVKQETPILVILGNPPYNGFAGMAVDEERDLSDAYRTTRRVRRPEGQGLNDLYVRFFRMAERRIAEKTGRGVVCFISNYSWLDSLSFTGMRERYLEAFDAVRIDCLNGDSRKTGKTAPDGSPDPSIFSTEGDPVGIQVGTAITTLVRKADHAPAAAVGFRHLWGQAKRADLTATAEDEPGALYEEIAPILPLGLPFVRTAVSEDWFDWPALPDLFPVSFPGVKTSRDGFLVDVDLARLRARVADYFDARVSHEEIARRYPGAMKTTARFDARAVRDALLARGGPNDGGFIRYAYRPFDNRWLYWEADTKLLDEKRVDYRPHVFEGNLWLVLQNKARPDLSSPLVISHIGDLNQMNSGVYCVPVRRKDDGIEIGGIGTQRRPNISNAAQSYLERLGADLMDLFHHVIAVLHDPSYREANADALRAEGPRIPLPGWPDGEAVGAAAVLAESAARGRELAALLDPDMPVPGVTVGALRPAIAAIAVPTTTDGRNMIGEDFAVTAGWGHYGAGDVVMPGQGRMVERAYTPDERLAMGDALPALGETTVDIYLNARTCWRNVPAGVWTYKLGGYQILKKWLSYREREILGRGLTPEDIQHFTDTARRIGAIVVAPVESSA